MGSTGTTAVFRLTIENGGEQRIAVDAAQAAELAAEALRALAHLTITGLTYPSDVNRILGHLTTALARIPQSLEQMGGFLGREHGAGHVVADYGRFDGQTDKAVSTTQLHLGNAAALADRARFALDAAQGACSGLSYTGADECARCGSGSHCPAHMNADDE